jgi:hypothetical protein
MGKVEVGLSDDLSHPLSIKGFLDPIANPHVIRFNLLKGRQQGFRSLAKKGQCLGCSCQASASPKLCFDTTRLRICGSPREQVDNAKGGLPKIPKREAEARQMGAANPYEEGRSMADTFSEDWVD